MAEPRLLTKEDIEVRVSQTSSYVEPDGSQTVKCSLLLYKNARVDMKILDELYTPMGWRRSHRVVNDNLYCQVDVWDAKKGEWIGKEDVGVESNTAAEKGEASDAFKRACVNWGIGRELYSAPKITIRLNDREWRQEQDGRIRVTASFSVGEIGYDAAARTIDSLTVVDRFGNVRYAYGKAAMAMPMPAAPLPQQPVYKPVDEDTYWKIIKAYATGVKSKSGGDYRTVWTAMTHAGQQELKQFDIDADTYKVANNIIQDI